MNPNQRIHSFTYSAREISWPQRILYALVGLVILVLGFFFLTVALVAGALIALVVIARWWWLTRKLRNAQQQDIFEGEYEVIERQQSDNDARKR
jgi:Flp pilus assembly protein TadB